jgi:serine/threonine-protein kinase
VVDVLRIGQQVADGLSAAHAQGLVHRDIKPGNILLERNVERVLLTDFGLARAADDASLTQSGVIAGTPQYMSPEQARGEVVDARTDLFSLGTVLYTLLSGHSPFRAETAMGVLRRVCEDTPRPLMEANPNVPAWLDAFIAKLHSKRPADRFESASQVSDLLTRCLAHVQQPSAVPLPDEVASLVKRPVSRGGVWWKATSHKIAVIAASCIAVAGVMIGLVNPNLFHRNDATQHQPAPETPSSNPATTDNNWHDTHDAEARELDQRTRRLEQDEVW